MSDTAVLLENPSAGRDPPGLNSAALLKCPLPVRRQGLDALSSDLCDALAEVGCPLTSLAQHRLQFETLLAELSATFINLAADQVDPRPSRRYSRGGDMLLRHCTGSRVRTDRVYESPGGPAPR
jgi:hypothetical protein